MSKAGSGITGAESTADTLCAVSLAVPETADMAAGQTSGRSAQAGSEGHGDAGLAAGSHTGAGHALDDNTHYRPSTRMAARTCCLVPLLQQQALGRYEGHLEGRCAPDGIIHDIEDPSDPHDDTYLKEVHSMKRKNNGSIDSLPLAGKSTPKFCKAIKRAKGCLYKRKEKEQIRLLPRAYPRSSIEMAGLGIDPCMCMFRSYLNDMFPDENVSVIRGNTDREVFITHGMARPDVMIAMAGVCFGAMDMRIRRRRDAPPSPLGDGCFEPFCNAGCLVAQC